MKTKHIRFKNKKAILNSPPQNLMNTLLKYLETLKGYIFTSFFLGFFSVK